MKLKLYGSAPEAEVSVRLVPSTKKAGAFLLEAVASDGTSAGGILRVLPNGTIQRLKMRDTNRAAFQADSDGRIKLSEGR